MVKKEQENKTPKDTSTKTFKDEKESSIVKFLFDKEYREKLGKIVKGEDKPDREKGWLNKYFDNISTTKTI